MNCPYCRKGIILIYNLIKQRDDQLRCLDCQGSGIVCHLCGLPFQPNRNMYDDSCECPKFNEHAEKPRRL